MRNLVILLLAIFLFVSGCGNDRMFSKNDKAWSGSYSVDITKNGSTEPVKVADAELYIKDGPFEFQDPIDDDFTRVAYSTTAKITIYGKLLRKSIKRECNQRKADSHSVTYSFDVLRGGKEYNVCWSFGGDVYKGQDVLDIANCWLDYPSQKDVQWVEISTKD